MRVVYRMRGLLGDATEDMVEKLDDGKDKTVDGEQEFKMAAVLSRCEGLEAVMWRLACVRDFIQGHQLISAALKLLDCCTKLKVLSGLLFISDLVSYCFVYFLAGEQAIPPTASSECSQYTSGSLQPGTYPSGTLQLPNASLPVLSDPLSLFPLTLSPCSLCHSLPVPSDPLSLFPLPLSPCSL